MTNIIETLELKVRDLSNIMDDEIALLKSGKPMNEQIIKNKELLLQEIENLQIDLKDAGSKMTEEEKITLKETISIFMDRCSLLKFELEKSITWTNDVISEIGKFIEIKLKGVTLYSKSGYRGAKYASSRHTPAFSLFEKI